MAPMECISAFGGWEGFAVSECRREIRGLASWCVIRLRRERVFGIEIEDCVRDDDP